eukprot:TRINITY_DN102267_c0_g1_i1.p1 TRINITY_DN102267_c0_g1~~TRINITY_DN102267_c0_g1_i1.p1  ORF type:complete len:147 (+),score=24.10 TRINITY_DN102267_c0_g1_i1:61-501(+)
MSPFVSLLLLCQGIRAAWDSAALEKDDECQAGSSEVCALNALQHHGHEIGDQPVLNVTTSVPQEDLALLQEEAVDENLGGPRACVLSALKHRCPANLYHILKGHDISQKLRACTRSCESALDHAASHCKVRGLHKVAGGLRHHCPR